MTSGERLKNTKATTQRRYSGESGDNMSYVKDLSRLILKKPESSG